MDAQANQSSEAQGYKYGQRVATPIGEGEVVARVIEQDALLICFSRKEFLPDVWKELCPANGPCTFRMVSSDDVRPVERK